jgi:hypothetical protein
MKLWKTITLVTGLCLVFGACSPFPNPPTPTFTPEPTNTLVPTDTPIPSNTPVPTNTPTLTQTPVITDVKIIQPISGAKVDQTVTINGTSQNIPDGSAIWVVIYLPAVRRFFPQNLPAVMMVNGNWSSVISIGQVNEPGLMASVMAVLADKSTQDSFNLYLQEAINKNDYPGLEKLPAGALIYQEINVERK